VNFLYPHIRWAWLPAMLSYSAVGALLAGCYGIVHDQITYSISSEYFTRLKFPQFRYADFGLPPRVFVAEIGFLATWWVGLIAAWFLARVVVPQFPPEVAQKLMLRGFAIVFAFAVAAGALGFALGWIRVTSGTLGPWSEYQTALGVIGLPRFVRVAYIHNAGYAGALLGLITAILSICRTVK
jgi:hypothetical protein